MQEGSAQRLEPEDWRIRYTRGQREGTSNKSEERKHNNSPCYLSPLLFSLFLNPGVRSSLTSPIIAAKGWGVTIGIRFQSRTARIVVWAPNLLRGTVKSGGAARFLSDFVRRRSVGTVGEETRLRSSPICGHGDHDGGEASGNHGQPQ
jgi:hypothetical protein